ncbi:MAG: class I SAM-dependent methyltransferase [Promethearchaeota archaeon]|nr:MAG: class I SAM-dependent methyltransferase [Candidatus Lokiarchaeota archaeon]
MIFESMLILRNTLYILLIILAIILFYLFVLIKIIRKIHPFPIPAFAIRFIDNPIRRRYIQKPDLIAKRMKLEPGMQVLEIGPGKGTYTKAVAKRILPDGIVYAIDIQENIIEKLKERLAKENISNITPKIDDAYDLSFENDSIDRIFAVACLPEIPDPVKVMKEFRRVLKKDGIISLCELFIDPDYPLRKTEKKWAKSAGLIFIEQFGNFFSYQLNFGKN